MLNECANPTSTVSSVYKIVSNVYKIVSRECCGTYVCSLKFCKMADKMKTRTNSERDSLVDDICAKMNSMLDKKFSSFEARLDKRLDDMEAKIEVRLEEAESRISKIEDEFVDLQQSSSGIPDKVKNLEAIVKVLDTKVNDLENRSRRMNVVIGNLEENVSKNESWSETETKVSKFINDHFGFVPKIVRAHRIGALQKNKHRPIVVLFELWKEKEDVIRKGGVLKGTSYWVAEDFSLKTRMKRKSLYQLAKKQFPNERIRLFIDHVFVAGKRYELNDDESGLKLVSRVNVASTV